MTNGGKNLRAFLTAQHGVDISLVETAIRDANWSVEDNASSGLYTGYSVKEVFNRVDALIVAGGASNSRDFGALMIEVGIALGLDKPVLVLWEESAPPPPRLPPELRIVRISLQNVDALRFQIKVFLANAQEGSKTVRPKVAVKASYNELNQLTTRLKELQARPAGTENDFLTWLEDLFRALGVKSVQAPRSFDRGFDLVVSAPADFVLDGPVLLEAKTRWPQGSQLRHLTERLASIVERERASLGLIVVLAGSDVAANAWNEWTYPSISVCSAEELLQLVSSNGSLAEILVAPRRDAGPA